MVLIACSTELYSCLTLAVFLSNLTYRKEQHQNEQDDNQTWVHYFEKVINYHYQLLSLRSN